MILRDMLEFAAARYPENPAIVDRDRRYTYAEWDERVSTVANALRSLGVGKGDRVVQVIKNREENCAIHMACQKLGAVNTPINFRWTSGEIEFCVNDAEARLVVIEEATAERVLSVRDEFDSDPRVLFVGPDAPEGVDSFDEAVEAAEHTRPSEEVEETDISLMLYTSGTTGQPKGVPRSQRAEYAATIAHIVEHRYALGERRDRVLCQRRGGAPGRYRGGDGREGIVGQGRVRFRATGALCRAQRARRRRLFRRGRRGGRAYPAFRRG